MFELYKLVSALLKTAFEDYFDKDVGIYQSEVVVKGAVFPYVTFDIQGETESFDETTISIVIDIYTKTQNSRADLIKIRDIIIRKFKEVKRLEFDDTVGASIYYENDFPLFTNEKLVKRHQVVFGGSVRICYNQISFKPAP